MARLSPPALRRTGEPARPVTSIHKVGARAKTLSRRSARPIGDRTKSAYLALFVAHRLQLRGGASRP